MVKIRKKRILMLFRVSLKFGAISIVVFLYFVNFCNLRSIILLITQFGDSIPK
jgi:hypothetical protein